MNETTTRNPQWLLLTPHSQDFVKLRKLISKALTENGFEPAAFIEDQINVDDSWSIPITEAIARADFIIADLTQNNPNIMYEIGMAHAWKKHVLPIVQRESESIPSDMTGYLFLVYDPENPEDLINGILSKAREIKREWMSR